MPPTRISCMPPARGGLPRSRPLFSVPPPATEAAANSSSSACLPRCQRNPIAGRADSSSSSSSASLLQFGGNFVRGAPTYYHRRPHSRLPGSCLCHIDVSTSSCLPYKCQAAFHTVAPSHVAHHQSVFRSPRVPYTNGETLRRITRNHPPHHPFTFSLPLFAAPLSASPTAATALAAAGERVGALEPGRRGGAVAAAAVRGGGGGEGALAAAVGGGGALRTTAAAAAAGGGGGDNIRAWQQQRRCMSSHEEFPEELSIGTAGSMDVPVGGAGHYRRLGALGMPMLFITRYDRPTWQPLWEDEYEQMVRDGYGVPGHIPPEVSQDIKQVYHVPPQFYHFLKKLGDDTPALQPYMHKLINGEFTHDDYEEMFYKFAKPLKIYRRQIPMPYRTPEEMAREDEVAWEGAWLSYRQRVLAYYNSAMFMREFLFGALIGIFYGWLFLDGHRQYRLDMKLFYLEAPEHKINWVKPRGDLV